MMQLVTVSGSLVKDPMVALGLSLAYCFLISRTVAKSERVRRVGWRISAAALVLMVAVSVLLFTLDVVHPEAIGPGFYRVLDKVVMTLWVTSVPALANVLLLVQPVGMEVPWYVAAFLCLVVPVCFIVLLVVLAEALGLAT